MSNEAAERLYRLLDLHHGAIRKSHVDAALAAERKATVERAALIAEQHAERLKHTSHMDGLGMGWLAGEALCHEIAQRIRTDAEAAR